MKPTLHGYIIVTEHLQLCVHVYEVHLKWSWRSRWLTEQSTKKVQVSSLPYRNAHIAANQAQKSIFTIKKFSKSKQCSISSSSSSSGGGDGGGGCISSSGGGGGSSSSSSSGTGSGGGGSSSSSSSSGRSGGGCSSSTTTSSSSSSSGGGNSSPTAWPVKMGPISFPKRRQETTILSA